MAFGELVRAAEGVPRDAINVAALAAQRALHGTISVGHVKAAARDWYERDKEAALKSPEARDLLSRMIDEVIGRRRVRAFLLQRGSRGSEDYAVRELYDARILHLIRRGVTAPDRPSLRYDGFVLDYGCYVDFSLPGYARTSEFWKAGVPPDHFRASTPAVSTSANSASSSPSPNLSLLCLWLPASIGAVVRHMLPGTAPILGAPLAGLTPGAPQLAACRS